MANTAIEAVDLFCGVGGLSYGLQQAGIVVRGGFDVDTACSHPYERNLGAKFFEKDVGAVEPKEVERLYSPDAVRLLAGCAPCQPFSNYSNGRESKTDPKWPLLYRFARLIRKLEPELVTMENVPNVVKHKVYHDFVQTLESKGYKVWAGTVKCQEYGLPQTRTRHVLLASKLGPISLIGPTHAGALRTVQDAIGHLPPISAGETHGNDPLHKAAGLSPLNLSRIRASRPGGTWRDWPEELVAKCHKKESGSTYPGVYGRMEWNAPSPTMTTQCHGFGNGRFGHPEQDRAISLREAALLQSFPEDYVFTRPDEPVSLTAVGRMIGNAVPPRLGEIIGQSLLEHVKALSSETTPDARRNAA
ncbi:DNA cytosine methyltransferase [Pseudothauera nasutitermitis]|uniref:DNA (cytosine-5-)-methyltransferase n=1 Tax=Pseudothauera nasutitermitis TaxID=2565930 RepID=A0A4S4AQF7_9RHOO|nr:DNA cytosine methyltransferase [Pseudothauera nasutitermitis]THF61407.1 DNA cytosine methyltransferase [Pseudothauera nasutitermitis]